MNWAKDMRQIDFTDPTKVRLMSTTFFGEPAMAPLADDEVGLLNLEDIEISDLELKDPEKMGWFARRPNRDVNLAAAEQVIKEELLSAGFLQVPDLGEKHADLVIADVIVSEDW